MHQEIHVKMTFDTNDMNCYLINIARKLIKSPRKLAIRILLLFLLVKKPKGPKYKKIKRDAFNCLGEPISELINESNEKLNQDYVLLSVFMCAELDPIPPAPVLLRRPVCTKQVPLLPERLPRFSNIAKLYTQRCIMKSYKSDTMLDC